MSDRSQSSKDPKTLAISSGVESKTSNIDIKIKKEDNSDDLDALDGGFQKLQLENEELQNLRLENAQLQRDLASKDEKIKQLENALADANARVEVARAVAVTLPPQIDQEESLIFYKLGNRQIVNGKESKINGNCGYVTRTRKENENAAFNRLRSCYPDISLIHRWNNVPNSKHLASSVRGELPRNSMRYNTISFDFGLNEEAIIALFEVANNDKIF